MLSGITLVVGSVSGPLYKHASSDAAAESANGLAAVERSAQQELLAERKAPIGERGVTVDVASVSPIFAAVVAGGADGEGVSEQRMRVSDARSISRLTRGFARLRLCDTTCTDNKEARRSVSREFLPAGSRWTYRSSAKRCST